MPTNRRYRTRVRQDPIDPACWALLTDTELPADANPFILLDRNNDRVMRPLWEENGAAILAEWIEAHPGTRPSYWWRYEAPRADPATIKGNKEFMALHRMIEPRRHLFGEGVPLHEVLNVGPSYTYGIPDWCGDPDNPPIFESQHAYLKRHSLLVKGERKPRVEPFLQPARIRHASR